MNTYYLIKDKVNYILTATGSKDAAYLMGMNEDEFKDLILEEYSDTDSIGKYGLTESSVAYMKAVTMMRSQATPNAVYACNGADIMEARKFKYDFSNTVYRLPFLEWQDKEYLSRRKELVGHSLSQTELDYLTLKMQKVSDFDVNGSHSNRERYNLIAEIEKIRQDSTEDSLSDEEKEIFLKTAEIKEKSLNKMTDKLMATLKAYGSASLDSAKKLKENDINITNTSFRVWLGTKEDKDKLQSLISEFREKTGSTVKFKPIYHPPGEWGDNKPVYQCLVQICIVPENVKATKGLMKDIVEISGRLPFDTIGNNKEARKTLESKEDILTHIDKMSGYELVGFGLHMDHELNRKYTDGLPQHGVRSFFDGNFKERFEREFNGQVEKFTPEEPSLSI